MAQKVQIVLEDDLVGGPATQTVTFGLDGVIYEIDLNDENASTLRDDLARWVAAGRKAGRSAARTPSRRKPAASGGTAHVREWLRQQGHTISDRGRIPAHLQEQYNAAH